MDRKINRVRKISDYPFTALISEYLSIIDALMLESQGVQRDAVRRRPQEPRRCPEPAKGWKPVAAGACGAAGAD